MADGGKDWDLGQKLIEKEFCTLDQVREALSIQDRMKQMGVVPKPLPEILLEKGYVTEDHLASCGVAPPLRKAAPRTASPSRPTDRTLASNSHIAPAADAA